MSDDEPLYVPDDPDWIFGTSVSREVRPSGYYVVTLYGQSGSILYKAHFPPYHGFSYTIPPFVGYMKVHGFEIIWEEM
jgi:hypothetical protein